MPENINWQTFHLLKVFFKQALLKYSQYFLFFIMENCSKKTENENGKKIQK